ncbi:MAG TPA: hypothetical protein VFC63_18925 [Blastocatellia bacterium]|nr:hypothetical protein [Blastocatellia bacterium]
MPEATDLDRDLLVVPLDEVEKALADSARHLRKIVVPQLKAEYNEINFTSEDQAALWLSKQQNHNPVVESQRVQLSWADEKAIQKPHWHNIQLETYSSRKPVTVVYRSVDDASVGFKKIQFTGRVFIPPRICHLVSFSGQTEVLQIGLREQADDLERDQIVCSSCHLSNVCSETQARSALGNHSDV